MNASAGRIRAPVLDGDPIATVAEQVSILLHQKAPEVTLHALPEHWVAVGGRSVAQGRTPFIGPPLWTAARHTAVDRGQNTAVTWRDPRFGTTSAVK